MFIPLNYTDTEVGTGDTFSGCKYIYSKISKKNAPIRKPARLTPDGPYSNLRERRPSPVKIAFL